MAEILDTVKENRVLLGVASILIGLGVGYAMENHTDDVARAKIRTVATCKTLAPVTDIITQEFHDCAHRGTPNGTRIGGDKFVVGTPVAYIDDYVAAQEQEQGIEADRLVLWGIAGVAIGASDFVF